MDSTRRDFMQHLAVGAVALTGVPTLDEAATAYKGTRLHQIDEELGLRTITAALEAGCTLIDTAALYGGALSEKMIGRVLHESGHQLVEPCDALHALGHPGTGESFPLVVFDVDVVMGLGPVVPDEHLPHNHLLIDIGSSSPRRPAAR